MRLSDKIRIKIYEGTADDLLRRLYESNDWATIDELREINDLLVTATLEAFENGYRGN